MSEYAGTGALLRLAARRDRLLITLSALALTALSVGSAKATLDLYPDAASARASLGAVLAAPSALALYGPASMSTIEGLSIFKTQLMGAVFVGILAYALVRRHTRVEEEEGRLELLRSGVVGRRAPLTAAVLLALAVTALTCLLSLAGLVGIGFDVVGSAAFAVSWLIAGLLMTGVTAVAAQLTASARGCTAWALGTLGGLYLMRAIGDTTPSAAWLSWAAPLGWVSKVSAYGDNRLVLALPALALCALLLALALTLLERRDLGSGLLAARPGPARGGPGLSSPEGLVWRLNRPSILGWSIAFVVLSAVVGGLAGTVSELLANPEVRSMLEALGGRAGSLTDIYLATELRFIAAAAAAAGIVLALRPAGEERSGRTEAVLATAASRTRWFLAHAVQALLLPVLLMVLCGLVITAAGRGAAEMPQLGVMIGAGLAAVPAAWVCVGVALALAGVRARFAPLAWGLLAVLFILGDLGTLLQFPTALVDLSPFAHLSQLPGGTFDVLPALVLVGIAAALTAYGVLAHSRRDIG